LHIESGNAGDVLVTSVAKALRFKRHKPATLLLVEARQDHMHLTMQRLLRLGRVALAMGTLTLMDATLGHGVLQALGCNGAMSL
jgi:hypothetical protein